MARTSIFDKIRSRQLQLNPKRSKEWYSKNIKINFMMGVSPAQLLANQKQNLTADIFIGKMFMFLYDPKTKETLPYWDKFPLVIPIDVYKGGFIGLNLHYLDVYNRIALLDKLLDFESDSNKDKNTKLQMTWNMLKGAAKYQRVFPCIKRYLSDHIRSRFIPIDAPDWEIAVSLPVERFVKRKPTGAMIDISKSFVKPYVHKKSMQQVNRLSKRRQRSAKRSK